MSKRDLTWHKGDLQEITEQEAARLSAERRERRHRVRPGRRPAAANGLAGVDLRAARTGRGVTQRELAERLEISQSQVSEIERRNDVLLSTADRFVSALGGHLQVNAVFDDRTVPLQAPQNQP